MSKPLIEMIRYMESHVPEAWLKEEWFVNGKRAVMRLNKDEEKSFAEWASCNGWMFKKRTAEWVNQSYSGSLTTSQLYDLYAKSKK